MHPGMRADVLRMRDVYPSLTKYDITVKRAVGTLVDTYIGFVFGATAISIDEKFTLKMKVRDT